MTLWRSTLALCALLAMAACSSPEASGDPSGPGDDAPFSSEEDYRQRRARAVNALENEVKTEASTVGACRVVPTSEQACGGPTSFTIFSAETSNAAAVERLAGRLVELDMRANAQFEWASTCMAYTPPTPRISDGRCVE